MHHRNPVISKLFFSSLIILFFFSILEVNAQTSGIDIQGNVTTTKGEKLDAAVVLLKDTEYRVLTNSDGSFLIKGVSPGQYHLICSYLGYLLYEQDITVSASG